MSGRRLKPGGGGVNAAIFEAAGSELEIETKKLAKTLNPGSALVVPLPFTSPLYTREGVTHVIHVLGPNMNPQRPNYLHGDYDEGCKLLRNTYSCLFHAFASAVQQNSNDQCLILTDNGTGNENKPNPGKADNPHPVNAFSILMQSAKRRNSPFANDQKMKRSKHDTCSNAANPIGSTDTTCKPSSSFDHVVSRPNISEHGNDNCKNTKLELDQNTGIFEQHSHRLGNDKKPGSKNSQPWAEELKKMARNPEQYKHSVLQVTEEALLIPDKFPKVLDVTLVIIQFSFKYIYSLHQLSYMQFAFG